MPQITTKWIILPQIAPKSSKMVNFAPICPKIFQKYVINLDMGKRTQWIQWTQWTQKINKFIDLQFFFHN